MNVAKDEISQKEQQNNALNASIQLALTMESTFKMYSYRLIDTDNYLSLVSQAVKDYDELITKLNLTE